MLRVLVVCLFVGFVLAQQEPLEVTYKVEVSTVAGSGRVGYKSGPALEAALNRPNGIVVKKDGTIYFSDDNNHCVRKVTPDGRVMLVAGSPRVAGFEDGQTEEALFNSPHGLALDPQGNLYVCDYFNHAIRRIAPDGQVTTIAGGNGAGFDDGPAKEATFSFPIAIVRDSKGNLYILETGNHALRKITPQGRVVTVAGQGMPGYRNGSGKDVAFNSPVGLAIDKYDNLYIVDAGNRAIRKVTPQGEVSTFVDLRFRGWQVRGSLGGLSFSTTNGQGGGVAVDADGNLYIADGGMHCVYQINPTEKTVEILAGTGKPGWIDGNGKYARFNEPVEICLGEKPSTFYVCDYRNAAIRKITIEKLEKYRKPAPVDTPKASPPEPQPMRFQVLDATTRKPLTGAKIQIKGPRATLELTTNASGEASTTLLPGEYTLTASCKDYEPTQKTLSLPQGNVVILTLSPVAPPPPPTKPSTSPHVTLRVVDEKSGQVIPEARVRWLQGQKAEAETQTNARGEAIQTLPPGTYRLQIDKKGYFPYTDSVQVGGADTITIMLKPALVGEMLRETRIHFQPNSAEIHPNSYPALDRIVDFLKANPQVRIRIHGHTDIGDKNLQYNIRLSEARANAVKDYLVQKGIDPQRIQTVGHGNTKPIADNNTIEGRARNRRVEFEVIAP